jgi:hypothetical protein
MEIRRETDKFDSDVIVASGNSNYSINQNLHDEKHLLNLSSSRSNQIDSALITLDKLCKQITKENFNNSTDHVTKDELMSIKNILNTFNNSINSSSMKGSFMSSAFSSPINKKNAKSSENNNNIEEIKDEELQQVNKDHDDDDDYGFVPISYTPKSAVSYNDDIFKNKQNRESNELAINDLLLTADKSKKLFL